MKMKQKRMRKIGIASALGLVVLVVLGLYGASNYMLNYSLNYPKEERMTAEHWKNRMKNECPWMIGWMDSVYQHHCVKDTFVTMPSGYKAHAIYLYAPKTTEKTAVVVHGYQVRSEGMLHIAYLYNHDMCSCQICMDTERARATISRWDGRIDGMSSDGRKSPMRFLE